MKTLLEDVEAFLTAFPEVRASHIGKAAVGDKGLVADLRAGRSPREVTASRVRAWMAAEVQRRAEQTRTRLNALRRVERGAARDLTR